MVIDKYLKYFIYAGLFLILLVPIIIWETSFFPFITGKNFIFRILVELVTGAWIILALRNISYRPRFSWLLSAVVAFTALLGISTILSEYSYKSFWSNFERMEGYITTLHLFSYFLVASSVLNTEKLWSRFLHASVGVSIYIGIYGILQLAGKIAINQGGVRLDGTLGNASYLAAYMLLHFFIVAFLFARCKGPVWLKWLYPLVGILQLVILFYTATRGAILGLIGGVLISSIIILALSEGWARKRKIALGILIAVLAVVGSVSLLKNSDFVKNNPSLTRLTSISLSEAGPRFMDWNMAWQGFKERPVFGWGQESFNYVFNKYYDPAMFSQEQWFDRTHNVALDWLIAGGIFGLAAYLFIFGLALYYVWKQGEENFSLKKCFKRCLVFWKNEKEPTFLVEKSVITGILAAYFFQNLFVFDNITSYIIFFSLLAYIHYMSGRQVSWLSGERFLKDKATVNRIFVPLAVVVTIFVLYTANVNQIRASTTLINALQPQSEGPVKNLEYFKKALAYKSFADPEIREQLTQAALQVIYSQSVDLALRQEFYDFAKSELNKQVERTPNDARYQLFLGSFLNRVRDYDGGINSLEKALSLSPKKQTIMFELGSAYINKGDTGRALEVMKKAFELDENFSEARIVYSVAAIYSGKLDLAEEIMSPLEKENSTAIYDDRIISAYSGVGAYTEVVRLLEKKVANFPKDPQASFSLAAAYLDANMRTKSLATLDKMLVDFPDSREQVEYYIHEIQAGRKP